MREHPILFSAPMVQAILAGNKSQTRRAVTRANSYVNGSRANQVSWARLDLASPEIFADPGPSPAGNAGPYLHVPRRDDDSRHRVYPQWAAGGRLWVRERFRLRYSGPEDLHRIEYADSSTELTQEDHGDSIVRLLERADWRPVAGDDDHVTKWYPSIHMPRCASRILLEITDVRVQRAQDISIDDAIAEGIERDTDGNWLDYQNAGMGGYFDHPAQGARLSFRSLWNSINAARGYAWDTNPWLWVLTFRRVA